MLKAFFNGIYRDRYILYSLVNRDLQMKYRRSKLGVAWAILTPLGLVVIVGSIYAVLFSTDPRIMIPTLFAGLNPWIFMSSTADGGTNAFLAAEGYIKQTTVNSQIFPLRLALVNFVNLLYSVLAFFIVYLFLQPQNFSAIMLLCIPGLCVAFIFSWGLANMSAIIMLYVRDYQPLQSLVLQGLFYVTPIIYDARMLQEKGVTWVYRFNPFYYMLEIIKRPMLGTEIPNPETYAIACILALATFLVSVLLIMRHRKEIAYKL